MAQVALKARKMPSNLTVKVTIIETPEYKLRMWLGKLLIYAAVWVWGCRVQFVE